MPLLTGPYSSRWPSSYIFSLFILQLQTTKRPHKVTAKFLSFNFPIVSNEEERYVGHFQNMENGHLRVFDYSF
jgi:hypothetical protein